MKKIGIISLFTLLFILCLSTNVYAEDDIKIFNNCIEMQLDVNPIIVNGRTLVPIRIAEDLGYIVNWDEVNRIVTLEKESIYQHRNKDRILLEINNPTVRKISMANDITLTTLDVAPIIKNGRTLIPIRFVAEELGIDVFWDNIEKDVHLGQDVSSCGFTPELPGATPSKLRDFLQRTDLYEEQSITSFNTYSSVLKHGYDINILFDIAGFDKNQFILEENHVTLLINEEVVEEVEDFAQYLQDNPGALEKTQLNFETQKEELLTNFLLHFETADFNYPYQETDENGFSKTLEIISLDGQNIHGVEYSLPISQEDLEEYLIKNGYPLDCSNEIDAMIRYSFLTPEAYLQ